MKKKSLLILLAALAVMVVMTACGGKGGGNAQELKVQLGPNPETMDPALNSAVDGGNMLLHAYECLLTVDKDGKLAPGQAEKWESSKDAKTWTFHLRDGLKWSDESPLTAKDFVYSWRRVCDPKVAAPYAETVLGMVDGYDKAIKGDLKKLNVVAKDDKTLVVKLAKPCTFFGKLAAFATLSPVQQKTIKDNGDKWATSAKTYVSNGPFRMTEWEPGSHITFEKNPNYWDKDKIKLDKLTFNLIEDSNAAYSAYKNGDLLMIKSVPTEEIPSLKDNKEYHVDPIMGTYYISLNCKKDAFKNEKVRKALNLAIDRKYVAETIMQGTYTPANSLIGPGWKDTDGKDFEKNTNGGKPYLSQDYKANMKEAKKLLAEAGYPNGKGLPQLGYTTNGEGYHKAVAEYVQKAWGDLGVKVKVNIVEWASFTPLRRNGEYDTARNGWVGDYDDPSNLLDCFYSTNGNNDGKYNNAEFDAQMDIARKIAEPKKRSEALHKAEKILVETAGMIPVAYYNDFWLQSEKIKGAWHSPDGYWHFQYATVE